VISALAILLLANLLDAAFGEPPNAVHPVSWMGHLIGWLRDAAPRAGPRRQLAAGLFIALVVPAVSITAGAALLAAASHPWLAVLVAAVILKTMMALRALGGAARTVHDALAAGDISGARAGLTSLCSRSPETLSPAALATATIESVAENSSDSFVAPLLAYAAFGVLGAIGYRAVNTMDAMIGYHGRMEYLGKAAARLDDLANLIPARVTALLLLAAGALLGYPVSRAWRIARRDARRTESPNAGWPMAVMAGLLGVVLDKPGHYRLGDPVRPVSPALIGDAWRITRLAGGLAVLLVAGLIAAGA
jgi:adenosylcobinamide-phosphate synthase